MLGCCFHKLLKWASFICILNCIYSVFPGSNLSPRILWLFGACGDVLYKVRYISVLFFVSYIVFFYFNISNHSSM